MIWVNSIFQMFTGYLPVLDNSRLYSLSQQSVAMSHSWSPSGKPHYDNISFFFLILAITSLADYVLISIGGRIIGNT